MEYKKIAIGQAKDLTFQRFGKLTAQYRTENKGTRTMWVCTCDCGTIKPIPAQDLTQGKTISCGCVNRQKASERMLQYNIDNQSIKIGDKFGNLEVIEHAGLKGQKSRDKRESWYLCKCECGSKPKEYRGNDLVSGNTISCGCIHSSGERQIQKILEENNIVFKKEYSFSDLVNPKTNRRLRFDFAIFEEITNKLLYLIEFDGRQHFTGPEAEWTHSSSLEDIQYRDSLKNDYCKQNNIILKRIPYTAISQLDLTSIEGDRYKI